MSELSKGSEVVKMARHRRKTAVFKVFSTAEQTTYALKVFHMPKCPDYSPIRWDCESRAYERFKSVGACESGLVPKLYAQFPHFPVSDYEVIERLFQSEDELRPCALLLEWLDIKSILDDKTYTRQRWEKGMASFRCLHEAYIAHLDVYPRNCIITNENPERVMWIDYDRSITYDKQSMTDRDRYTYKEDLEIAKDLGPYIEDQKNSGKPLTFN